MKTVIQIQENQWCPNCSEGKLAKFAGELICQNSACFFKPLSWDGNNQHFQYVDITPAKKQKRFNRLKDRWEKC